MTNPAPFDDTRLRRGILRAFNAGTYLADVQLDGSLQRNITSVPTARDIASGEMVTGRKVAVAFFDPNNPADAAVLAVWT